MLNSIYHMTLKLLKNHIFGEKTSRFCHVLRNVKMDVIICLFDWVLYVPVNNFSVFGMGFPGLHHY